MFRACGVRWMERKPTHLATMRNRDLRSLPTLLRVWGSSLLPRTRLQHMKSRNAAERRYHRVECRTTDRIQRWPSRHTAWTSMPCSLPTKPRCSVVVALILTADWSILSIEERQVRMAGK
jgi:hypothetical protein